MTAWWTALRGDVRRFGRRALLLALFLALGGGVVLSAFIGARRDATVVDRLAARINVATAALLPNDPSFDWSPVARLPNVRTLQRFAVTYFDVVDHPEIEEDFPRVGAPTGEPIEDVAVVRGRRVDQTRVDEVTLGAAMADRSGVDVGDQLVLRVQASDVLRAMIAGGQPPSIAPTDVRVHVVGIVKGGPFAGGLQTTEAFTARYADDLVPPGAGYVNALVRLEGGRAAIDELSRQVDQLAGRPVEVMDVSLFVHSVRTATGLESTALLAFAVTAGLVVVVLGGIWVSRATSASADSLPVLSALGFTRRDGILLAAALPAAAALVGAAGAAVVAVVLSARFPIGLGRELEPSPGTEVHVVGLLVGSASIAVLGVAVALVAARRVERRATSAAPSSAPRSWWVAPPLPASIGTRLAVSGWRDGGSRSATVALTVGVVAVVGALTFGAGLDRAAADGSLSGQLFDSFHVNIGRSEPPAELVEAWRGDDRVVAASRITDLVVGIDGASVALLSIDDLKGAGGDRALRGRLPQAIGEVSFAPGELQRLGVTLGDTVHLADGTPLRVVGESFTVALGHTSYDGGGRVTPEQMAAIEAAGTQVKFDVLAIDSKGTLSDSELDEVWLGRDHEASGLVDPQRDLGRTRSLPRALAWFAGALAAVTAAVVLIGATRRRRREVAVLQVLGLTRRQARQIIGWQLLASVAVAIVVGLPLGFAVGRTLWQAVVDGIPLRYATPTAWGAIGLVVLGVTVLAGLLALRPMTMTAADEPALSLRTE